MKTLMLLRHAKSSWDDPDLDDHDRPLNKRGKRDAPRMGKLLAQQDLTPELIVTSTAKRARRTARAVAEACGYEGQMVETGDLYHAPAEGYVEVLRRLPPDVDCPLLVGHNPGMEDLLARLTGSDEIMPTAALAKVSLPVDAWDELTSKTPGTLINLWLPRELNE
jgi:phosphohistidine phosphatase